MNYKVLLGQSDIEFIIKLSGKLIKLINKKNKRKLNKTFKEKL